MPTLVLLKFQAGGFGVKPRFIVSTSELEEFVWWACAGLHHGIERSEICVLQRLAHCRKVSAHLAVPAQDTSRWHFPPPRAGASSPTGGY